MSDLAKFLRSKKRMVKQRKQRQTELLKRWQRSIEDLIGTIESWVSPAISEGLKVQRDEVQIEEEDLGKYKLPALKMRFDGIRVEVKPVARFVLGAQGRVDIVSPLGVFYLLRFENADAEGGVEWYLVRDRLEDKKPLTKQVFEELLKDIFDLV